MKTYRLEDRDKERAEITRVLELFAADPALRTCTIDDIEEGARFFLRWGLDNDCILYFKIGDEPQLVQNCLPRLPRSADKRNPEVNSSLEWGQTLFEGKAGTLAEAEEVCLQVRNGWRLPTRQELESLLDLSRCDPAVDPDMHPDMQNKPYWTSTPCAVNGAANWVVHFAFGSVYGNPPTDRACVRLVRTQGAPAHDPA